MRPPWYRGHFGRGETFLLRIPISLGLQSHQLSEKAHRQLHRELSGLELVSRLARELEDKQQVG